ncbi:MULTISPECIES: hypothetical protein [unclassified Streptomyces]|nr:hypothetical protein OG217_37485 [Streptomyces sp. NBC_01023]
MGAFVHWGNINVWVRRVVVAPRSSAVLLLKAVHIDITADLAPPTPVNNR